MQIDWKLLYSDLNTFRSNLSWRDLASEWELPPSTFTRISKGQSVRAEVLAHILASMDVRVERYVLDVKQSVVD